MYLLLRRSYDVATNIISTLQLKKHGQSNQLLKDIQQVKGGTVPQIIC